MDFSIFKKKLFARLDKKSDLFTLLHKSSDIDQFKHQLEQFKLQNYTIIEQKTRTMGSLEEKIRHLKREYQSQKGARQWILKSHLQVALTDFDHQKKALSVYFQNLQYQIAALYKIEELLATGFVGVTENMLDRIAVAGEGRAVELDTLKTAMQELSSVELSYVQPDASSLDEKLSALDQTDTDQELLKRLEEFE